MVSLDSVKYVPRFHLRVKDIENCSISHFSIFEWDSCDSLGILVWKRRMLLHLHLHLHFVVVAYDYYVVMMMMMMTEWVAMWDQIHWKRKRLGMERRGKQTRRKMFHFHIVVDGNDFWNVVVVVVVVVFVLGFLISE